MLQGRRILLKLKWVFFYYCFILQTSGGSTDPIVKQKDNKIIVIFNNSCMILIYLFIYRDSREETGTFHIHVAH